MNYLLCCRSDAKGYIGYLPVCRNCTFQVTHSTMENLNIYSYRKRNFFLYVSMITKPWQSDQYVITVDQTSTMSVNIRKCVVWKAASLRIPYQVDAIMQVEAALAPLAFWCDNKFRPKVICRSPCTYRNTTVCSDPLEVR